MKRGLPLGSLPTDACSRLVQADSSDTSQASRASSRSLWRTLDSYTSARLLLSQCNTVLCCGKAPGN